MIAKSGVTSTNFIFLGCWAMVVLVVGGFATAGLTNGAAWEFVSLAALVSSIFAIPAVILSNWLSTLWRRWSFIGWTSLLVISTCASIVMLRSGLADADILQAYTGLALTFPIGFIVAPLADVMPPQDRIYGSLQMAVAFFVAGYVQWFVVLPRVVALRRPSK